MIIGLCYRDRYRYHRRYVTLLVFIVVVVVVVVVAADSVHQEIKGISTMTLQLQYKFNYRIQTTDKGKLITGRGVFALTEWTAPTMNKLCCFNSKKDFSGSLAFTEEKLMRKT